MTSVTSLNGVSDPKQGSNASSSWYRYYAGYSPRFVADSLDLIEAASEDTILDPWMGAGTTLAVAAGSGLNTLGLDLNPAMVVVTKGRLLSVGTRGSLVPLARELLDTSASAAEAVEPLTSWFTADTSRLLRGLAQRIDQVLIGEFRDCDDKVDQMSSLAAFYYVALFTVVKNSVRRYQSKNPTWTKREKISAGTVTLTVDSLSACFLNAVRDLQKRLSQQAPLTLADTNHDICRGDSRTLPFDHESVDHVITSPPYCTRLDYVVGHHPELATLGYTEDRIIEIRQSMIGTPTIQSTIESGVIGATAAIFLDRVASHPSYASKSYYAKTFRQYFLGMAQSMDSINIALKPGGNVILVVQDSRYKELHLDLAGALRDMASEQGWHFQARKNFTAARSIVQVNPRTTEITRRTKPVESILYFTKGK